MKKLSIEDLKSEKYEDQIVHAASYVKGGDDPPAATLGKIQTRGGG